MALVENQTALFCTIHTRQPMMCGVVVMMVVMMKAVVLFATSRVFEVFKHNIIILWCITPFLFNALGKGKQDESGRNR